MSTSAHSSPAPDHTPTGFANLRDVASGLAAGLVRPGVLFRSDAPFAGDPIPTLPGWPPASVIDLRDPAESRVVHPYTGSAHIYVLPLLGAAKPVATRDEQTEIDRMLKVYRAMVKPRIAPYLVQAIEIIANETGPVLVHCAAGKDRTGVTVAFALRLCGVDRASVMSEYLITDQAREGLYKRLAVHYALEPDFSKMSTHALRTSPPGLDDVMNAWDAHEGGTEGWYFTHGGTKEILAKLRARMLLAP